MHHGRIVACCVGHGWRQGSPIFSYTKELVAPVTSLREIPSPLSQETGNHGGLYHVPQPSMVDQAWRHEPWLPGTCCVRASPCRTLRVSHPHGRRTQLYFRATQGYALCILSGAPWPLRPGLHTRHRLPSMSRSRCLTTSPFYFQRSCPRRSMCRCSARRPIRWFVSRHRANSTAHCGTIS